MRWFGAVLTLAVVVSTLGPVVPSRAGSGYTYYGRAIGLWIDGWGGLHVTKELPPDGGHDETSGGSRVFFGYPESGYHGNHSIFFALTRGGTSDSIGKVDSSYTIERTTLWMGGYSLEFGGLRSSAEAKCLQDGTVSVTGRVDFANLTLNGVPLATTPVPNQVYDLPDSQLVINEQIVSEESSATKIHVTALRLRRDLFLGANDVRLGWVLAGMSCTG